MGRAVKIVDYFKHVRDCWKHNKEANILNMLQKAITKLLVVFFFRILRERQEVQHGVDYAREKCRL